jgi:hypothetical protein
MQNRYAGDVGDFVKISLLRFLSQGRKLGISWYLYPDENHNSDGRHIAYLEQSAEWRHLDPELFDLLTTVVRGERTVESLRKAFDPASRFFSEPIAVVAPAKARSLARSHWFEASLSQLSRCDLVFADPDNGLVDDQEWRRRSRFFGKQMPLAEARALGEGRCAVIYHHNSRFRGGHDAEVNHWLRALGMRALAVRATAYSCRTFFIVNPDAETAERTKEFCRRWAKHKVRLHQSPIM